MWRWKQTSVCWWAMMLTAEWGQLSLKVEECLEHFWWLGKNWVTCQLNLSYHPGVRNERGDSPLTKSGQEIGFKRKELSYDLLLSHSTEHLSLNNSAALSPNLLFCLFHLSTKGIIIFLYSNVHFYTLHRKIYAFSLPLILSIKLHPLFKNYI